MKKIREETLSRTERYSELIAGNKSNDEFIDFLDDETNARFNNYWKVVDSMSYQSADISTLDNIVDNLDDNYEYVR